MKTVTYRISYDEVMNEVAKTTSYAGQKTPNDKDAYERMRTTSADEGMLQRFWSEACADLTRLLTAFGVVLTISKDYVASVSLPATYDTNLSESIEDSMYSYAVSLITAKWFRIAAKTDADTYYADASVHFNEVKRKIYYRKKIARQDVQEEDVIPLNEIS